jgi:hypothetical protein
MVFSQSMKTTVAGGFGGYAELLPLASEIVRTRDVLHGFAATLGNIHGDFFD